MKNLLLSWSRGIEKRVPKILGLIFWMTFLLFNSIMARTDLAKNFSVSLNGGVAIVGEQKSELLKGNAITFTKTANGTWERSNQPLPEMQRKHVYAVAVSDYFAVVGAEWHDNFRGAAYILERHGDQWQEVQKLTPADGGPYDHFGQSVAIYGETVLVGAPWQDMLKGAVYIYKRMGAEWVAQQKIMAPQAQIDDRFGTILRQENDNLIVSPKLDGQPRAAYRYRFDASAEKWTGAEPAEITPQSSTLNAQAQSDMESGNAFSLFSALSDGIGDQAGINAAQTTRYKIETFAVNGTAAFYGDGNAATNASFWFPNGTCIDQSGNVYIADHYNHRIRMVDTNGYITTVAGNGTIGNGGDGGQATEAQLNVPLDVHCDGTGNLYILDYVCVRKVDLQGEITTVAGDINEMNGYGGDGGPATNALFAYPSGIYVDPSGNLYIADSGNNRIRKVDLDGIITTVAGNGTPGFSGDYGAATSAQLNDPDDVTVDDAGNLYITDSGNNRIRKVDTNDIITTVAGNGSAGFSGDGSFATAAELNKPRGIDVDAAGNIYFSDNGNYRIRRVDVNGIITTFAGTGSEGCSGDGGLALEAELKWPGGLCIDAEGLLYFADTGCHTVRVISPLPWQVSWMDATDSTYEDRVEITWGDTERDDILYRIERDSVVIAYVASTLTQLNDQTGTPTQEYNYCVIVQELYGQKYAQVCDNGSRTIFAPEMVQASDGAFTDRVKITWDDKSTIETQYIIYRDNIEIDTLGANQTVYEDTTAQPDVYYTYEVEAFYAPGVVSQRGRDWGFATDILPPLNVTASYGIYPDKVVITWTDQTDNETGFSIYRNEDKIGQVAANVTTFEDTAASPGVVYGYWVCTLVDSAESVPSEPAEGGIWILPPPEDVTASDSTYDDRVEITWSVKSDLQDGFIISRDDVEINRTAANAAGFTDYDAKPNVTHSYSVQAFTEEGGLSGIGGDWGTRAMVLAPVEVVATDGDFEDRAEITWQSNATNAQTFMIYRDNIPIKTVDKSILFFSDPEGVANQVHSYRVSALTLLGDESAKTTDQGYRRLLPPTRVIASDNEYEDKVLITWEDNSNYESGYMVYRRQENAVDSVAIDTLDANLTSTLDLTGVPGEKYVYSVAAFHTNEAGISGYSKTGSNPGFRALKPPSGVQVGQGEYETQIEITWEDNCGVETGYRVFRKDSPTAIDSILVAETPPNTVSFMDDTTNREKDFTPCVTYTYTIVALDNYGQSDPAQKQGFSTVFPAQAFNASDMYRDMIKLIWLDGSAIETGYRIYRDGAAIDSLTANSIAYIDTSGQSGVEYKYCIEAYCGAGKSELMCDVGIQSGTVKDDTVAFEADGFIGGRITTAAGDGVDSVTVALDPAPNNALLFDGIGGYVRVEQPVQDDFTIECWFKTRQSGHHRNDDHWWCGYSLVVTDIAGIDEGFGVTLYDGRVYFGAKDLTLKSTQSYADGKWHHVAATREQSSGSMMLYVDGTLVNSVTNSPPVNLSLQPYISFGRIYTWGAERERGFFEGQIDELRIWKKARTLDEIKSDMHLQLTGEEADLAGYWPLDTGVGRIAADMTENSNHGYMYYGVYWSPGSDSVNVETITDDEGNYTVSGIFYGDGTTFKVRPSKGKHQFKPVFKTITLNKENPIQNEVGFTDMTSFGISGEIVFKGYEGCPAQNIEILVPGKGTGFPAPSPQIRTCGIITYGSSVYNRTKIYLSAVV